jgi:hypothetical protein
MRRWLGVSLLSFVLLAGANGCLGSFQATQEVRGFNLRAFEGKWPREITFLALYIVPVYPFAALGDLFVFNSIEFWVGENPISGEPGLLSWSRRDAGGSGGVGGSGAGAGGSAGAGVTVAASD